MVYPVQAKKVPGCEAFGYWVRILELANFEPKLLSLHVSVREEFSGLGFIGMFLFLVTQSHVTEDVLARKVAWG